MLDKKDAPLLDDYVFKRTFTRDDPNGILRDFLESVLKEEYLVAITFGVGDEEVAWAEVDGPSPKWRIVLLKILRN